MCVTSPMEVGGCFWGQDYSRLRSFRGDGGFLCTSPLPACRTWGSPQGPPRCSEYLSIVEVGTPNHSLCLSISALCSSA